MTTPETEKRVAVVTGLDPVELGDSGSYRPEAVLRKPIDVADVCAALAG